MGFAENAVSSIDKVLKDTASAAILIVSLTIVLWLYHYLATKAFAQWTGAKPWWPDAAPRQKALLMNFGYPEEAITPKANLESFGYVLTTCVHHFISGALCIPVIFWGWNGSWGAWGQFVFYIGMLLVIGFDVADTIACTFRRFCPKFWPCQEPEPCFFWFIMVVCHHPISIFLVAPLLRYYPEAHQFHRIACSLLLAAGICYITGAWKFTLNTKLPADFTKYKAIVVAQMVTIYYSRLYVWLTEAYTLIGRFRKEESQNFYHAGIALVCLMTIFNLVMVFDCTEAAIKWLPKKMPTDEAEVQDLERSKSNLSGAILAGSFIRPAPAGDAMKSRLKSPNEKEVEF